MNKPYTPETEEWAFSFDKCFRCGKRGGWRINLWIHHLVMGTSKHKNDLATTMLLCWACHECEHHNTTGDHRPPMGLLQSLAIKQRIDPAHYSLARVLELRGNAPTFIRQEYVDAAAKELGI